MMTKTVVSSDALGESYYCYRHPSGLEAVLYPMPQFSSVYALFGTRYGSIDNTLYEPDGTKTEVPEGIAHYLEHKMFEKEDGDVSAHFSAIGANSNAFTSFECTSYLFSTTGQAEEALRTLIQFVQTPYFTEESVRKERGIIDQEIRMYEDDPNWRVFFHMLENLYHAHPVRLDVAGSSSSIANITPELLYRCYGAYYNPANMVLAVAGNIDPDRIAAIVEETARNDVPPVIPKKEPIHEPDTIVRSYSEEKLAVSAKLFHIGFKERPVSADIELETQLYYTLLNELIAGRSSALYQRLYEEKAINASFGKDIMIGRDFAVNIFSGEAENPEYIAEEIVSAANKLRKNGISDEDFSRVLKSLYGQSVMMFGEVDQTANALLSAHLSKRTLFDALSILKNVQKKNLEQLLSHSYQKDKMTLSVVLPQDILKA